MSRKDTGGSKGIDREPTTSLRPDTLSPGTETIDLDGIFAGEDVSATGSFHLGDIRRTTLVRLLDALPIPAFLVSHRYAIVYANQACERIGSTARSLIEVPFAELFPREEDITATDGVLEELFARRTPKSLEAVLQFDGGRIWARLNFRAVRLGRQRYALVLVEDLTADKRKLQLQKEYEEELRGLTDKLEQRVKERTAQLEAANQQLQAEIKRRESVERELRKVHLHLEERVKERTAELSLTNSQLRKEILQRKKFEEALRRSEQKYRDLAELNPQIVFELDMDGRVTFVNQTGLRVLGYTSEEVSEGIGALDLISPEDRGRAGADLRKVMDGRAVGGTEYMVRRKDGSTFPIVAYSTPIVRGGEVVGLRGVYFDVTELKRTQAALQESRERLDYLLSSNPAVIYSCVPYPPYRATFVSDNAEYVLGHKASDYTSEESFWLSRMYPEDAERMPTTIAALLEAGRRTEEYRILHGDGTCRWIRDDMNLIRDDAGNPTEIVGSCIDVTEGKRVEEELAASLREKEVLLREIHHRVKNNLQVICSLIALQSMYADNRPAAEIVSELEGRVRSISLVHEKLYQSRDLSRIAAEEYMVELTDHLLSAYGTAAAHLDVTVEAGDVSLGIDTAIPCGLIITELITNALKHAFPDKRPGSISVSLRGLGGCEYELKVADDGIGFPEGVDPHVAETLGLDLVRTLSEQLRGQMRVDRDNGTLVTIRFRELGEK